MASLAFRVPEGEHFVLRGTIPLPRSTHPSSAGPLLLGVEVQPGKALPAQLEVVSRYARASDGADVVEVLARVPRPEAIPPGTRAHYPLVLLDQAPAPPVKPLDHRQGLVEGPLLLPQSVVDLLTAPESIVLLAQDVFGNPYHLDLLHASSVHRLTKYGHHHAELRSHGTMMPATPTAGSKATLPHLFGAHSYLGTWSGEPVVTLDLRVHNGHDGANPSTSSDDPLGQVYFRQLTLRVPEGYGVLQAFDNPLTGANHTQAGHLHWAIVEPNPDGSLHVMPPHGQFHRRLAIAPVHALARARELLDQAGRAFAIRGTSTEGHQLYSWWNPDTARWFPQRFQLPSLEHVGLQALMDQGTADLESLLVPFAAGASTTVWPFISPRLGWAHPHGVSYGGMTGGDEIVLVDGVTMLEAASPEAYRAYQLRHRANTDRQPRAFYRFDGRPTQLEDWVVENAGSPYVFSFYMGLQGKDADPMGWSQAPTFQVDAVAALGLQPSYEDELLAYQPHDLQHLIRYTRNAKVLAWAGNDSLAKDDIWMQAELFRLSYHPYLNGAWGYKDPTGMHVALDFVQQHPGMGFAFGRGEGWGLDVATARFAFASDAWRVNTEGWFRDVVEMLQQAQIPCNGHIYADAQLKLFAGKFRAAQTAEDAIVQNALLALSESVLAGNAPAHQAMAVDSLVRSLGAMTDGIQWHPTLHGPMAIYAVGPLHLGLPVFCTAAAQPAAGKTAIINTYQTWSAFGYGYHLTGNFRFLERAGEMAQSDLLPYLLAAGTKNIENRAALLAVLQREYGLLP